MCVVFISISVALQIPQHVVVMATRTCRERDTRGVASVASARRRLVVICCFHTHAVFLSVLAKNTYMQQNLDVMSK